MSEHAKAMRDRSARYYEEADTNARALCRAILGGTLDEEKSHLLASALKQAYHSGAIDAIDTSREILAGDQPLPPPASTADVL